MEEEAIKKVVLKDEIVKGIGQKPLQFALIGIVGIGIIYFVIKKVLPDEEARAKKRQEDERKKAETSAGGNNPFNYVDFLNQKIPIGTTYLSAKGAYQHAKQLYDSLNTFYGDDEDIAIGVFASLKSKLNVALMCQSFYLYYKRDVLQYLKSGNKTVDFGSGGLSNEDVERIITLINKKPKY